MTSYPGPSTNLMALALIALCVVMVVYGLWRLYRIAAAARHRDIDPATIQMFLDGIRETPRPDEEPRNAPVSDEVLKAFYEEVNPPDQRYLH